MEPGTSALILELGANDMLRGLDPAEAKANLSAILDRAKEKGLPVLLAGIAAPGNYGTDYRAAFDAMWPDLSAAYGTLLVTDFLGPVKDAVNAGTPMQDLVQEDGLHPNARGVDLIVLHGSYMSPTEFGALAAALAEVVLAVHFQPAGRGPRARELRVMPRAQPDAGAEPRQAQPFFILASLPGSPCFMLPPICTQVPAFTTLKSFGS